MDKTNKKKETLILNAIGVIFETLGGYDQAQIYYDKALILAYNSGLDELQMVGLSNLGVLYKNQELMHQCGFQNRGIFYRAFNAKVGMTPKEFRKKVVSEREIV
jgi:AraC-like DNA-binding protein